MAEFTELVQRVIAKGFTPTDISDRLGVTRGAAERWADGRAFPHPHAEPIFSQKLRELFDVE